MRKIRIGYYNIAVFLMLFYAYLSSVSTVIYGSKYIIVGSFALAVILAVIPSLRCLKLNNYLLLWVAGFLYALLYNRRLASGDFAPKLFFWFAGVLCMLFLASSCQWIKLSVKLMLYFTVMHIIFCWVFKALPSFYTSRIIPLFDADSQELLRTYFSKGYMVGLTSHYSAIAMYLGNGIVLEYALYLNAEKKKSRRRLAALMAITLITLILTGKRGMLVFSLMAVIIFTLVYHAKDAGKTIKTVIKLSGVFMLFSAVVVALAHTIMPQIWITMSRFLDSGLGDDVTSGRMRMWLLALDLFKENPIFGIGWNGYRIVYSTAWHHSSLDTTLDTHNVYLQLLCETGIIGSIIFFSVMFGAIYHTVKALRRYRFAYRGTKEDVRILSVSCALQILFLLYCFTGNPLYDPQTSAVYFFSIAAWQAIVKKELRGETEIKRELKEIVQKY